MQPRNIQSGFLVLFAVLSAWLMPWVASAAITLIPAAPTTGDSVQIEVTWNVSSPCHTVGYTQSIVANRIRIDLTAVARPGGGCAGVIVRRTVTVPVGVLAAGNYAVEVYQGNSQLLFTAAFDVITSSVVVIPQEGQAVHLRVRPRPPGNYDVQVEAMFMMPSDCFAASGSASVIGNSIRADVTVVTTGRICTARVTPQVFTSPPLGELPPGKYNVVTYYNGLPGVRGDFTIMPDVIPLSPELLFSANPPSSFDEVSVQVSATLPGSCYAMVAYPAITGSEIRIDVSLVGTHVGCVDQPTLLGTRGSLGKIASGSYVVHVYFNGVLRLTSDLTVTPSADLALSQTVAPNPVKRKGVVLHSIDVVNNGPDAAGGVTVSSVLPTNLSYVRASASQGACTVTNEREVTCALGSLRSGVIAKVGILARAQTVGLATLSATVKSDAVDFASANNSAGADILIRK